METIEAGAPLRQVGRYTIFDQIGAGGMATVHLARFSGPAGFSRVVAVKHLLPHLSFDAEFKALIVEEARTASRVRHPNVVPTLDVVVDEGDVYIVMEYVPGETLSFLRRAAKEARQDIPAAICSAVLVGALQGLHAAHEARTPSGELLDIVHRDVSPPNILVGSDGVPVVLDFGIAKTLQGKAETRSGRVKGKSSYMAPEQIRGEPITRAVDIFAAAVVLWELLTGRRLFFGATEQERMRKVLEGAEAMPPSLLVPRLPKGLDEVVLRGLRQNPRHRFKTALEMAEAIEKVAGGRRVAAPARGAAEASRDRRRRDPGAHGRRRPKSQRFAAELRADRRLCATGSSAVAPRGCRGRRGGTGGWHHSLDGHALRAERRCSAAAVDRQRGPGPCRDGAAWLCSSLRERRLRRRRLRRSWRRWRARCRWRFRRRSRRRRPRRTGLLRRTRWWRTSSRRPRRRPRRNARPNARKSVGRRTPAAGTRRRERSIAGERPPPPLPLNPPPPRSWHRRLPSRADRP